VVALIVLTPISIEDAAPTLTDTPLMIAVQPTLPPYIEVYVCAVKFGV
jgi:hypothetical protein